MSADSQTPPGVARCPDCGKQDPAEIHTCTPPLVSIGEVAALLRTESVVASVEWNEAPEGSAEEERLQHRAIKFGRAASTLERVAGVLRDYLPEIPKGDLKAVGERVSSQQYYAECALFVFRLRTALSPTSGGGQ